MGVARYTSDLRLGELDTLTQGDVLHRRSEDEDHSKYTPEYRAWLRRKAKRDSAPAA